jgi:membrane fusion protein, multidrug efflux system
MTIDNQIDTTTGTVRLRAEFPNTDNALFLESVRECAPEPRRGARSCCGAHGRDPAQPPNGTFVYVVNQRHTVEARPVTVGITDGAQTQIIKGVARGEVVVVDGADRIREGSPVDARLQRS